MAMNCRNFKETPLDPGRTSQPDCEDQRENFDSSNRRAALRKPRDHRPDIFSRCVHNAAYKNPRHSP